MNKEELKEPGKLRLIKGLANGKVNKTANRIRRPL